MKELNTRKDRSKIVAIQVKAKCSFCHQELLYPAKFNALIFCPNKNVRAQNVPESLTRLTLNNRHVLVEAPDGLHAQPKKGLFSRAAAAAVASALHVFKASGK